jgi:hypothetical protein
VAWTRNNSVDVTELLLHLPPGQVGCFDKPLPGRFKSETGCEGRSSSSWLTVQFRPYELPSRRLESYPPGAGNQGHNMQTAPTFGTDGSN